MAYFNPATLTVQRVTARPERQPREQSLDLNNFVPGLYHFPTPPPTPAAILNGAYRPGGESIEYFPRRADYCGRPTLSIRFTVHGHPAPYLKEIFKDRVLLDNGEKMAFAGHGWSRTRWVLEWPGYEKPAQTLPVAGLTCTMLAKYIAGAVVLFLKEEAAGHPPLGSRSPWAAHNVRFGDIRLVALNYYGRVWVPVFAVDANY
ncbi:hypothetical protein C8R43DRAFT_1133620 [Mycena crocata]|nr:hypothetical protein C8R43DRAFT_1133620 [Mycena crocata]